MSYNDIIAKEITVNELTRPLLIEGKEICKNSRRYVKKARNYICRRHGIEEFLKISVCFHEIESALTFLLDFDLEESYENRGYCWKTIIKNVDVLFCKLQDVIWLDAGIAYPLLSEAEALIFKLNGLLNRVSEISSTEKNEEIEEK